MLLIPRGRAPGVGDSNPAAGLLLLLVGVMLLLMYVTGRLDWLFSIGKQVDAARGAPVPVPTGAPGAPGSPIYGPPLPPSLQTSPQGATWHGASA